MTSTWHDGLVQAFPVPLSDSPATSGSSDAGSDVSTEEASALSQSSTELAATASPSLFFSLPAEIRNRIYRLVLFTAASTRSRAHTTTRTPTITTSRRLPTSLFQTSSLIHAESSHLFYTTYPFQLFPLQTFSLNQPPLPSLPSHYRTHIKDLTLTLGPSWTSPPKSWRVTPYLSRILQPYSLPLLRCLHIFVAIDPSHPVFQNFRMSKGFYTDFATALVADVLSAMKQVQVVHVQANPSVSLDGPLVVGLRKVAGRMGRVVWLGADQAPLGGGDDGGNNDNDSNNKQ